MREVPPLQVTLAMLVILKSPREEFGPEDHVAISGTTWLCRPCHLALHRRGGMVAKLSERPL